MTCELGGLWPAVVTPINDAGQPALDVLEQLVELFVQQKLGGLYVVGSTGQWPLFTLAERMAIAERVVRTSAGRIPVMLHIGAATTADAVTLARHAAEIGADAVSAVGPIYYSYSADVIFDYYKQIGAATNLPLYAYHLSVVNQLKLPPQDYVRRLLEIPNIAGMKITDIDLYLFGLIQTYSAGKLRLFSGADEVLCHAVLSGAIGAIGTFYNLWGPACDKARSAMSQGNVALATRFTARFQEAISTVLSSGSVWTFLRSAMRIKYGLEIGMPRAPLGSQDKPWADADVRRVIALVDEFE